MTKSVASVYFAEVKADRDIFGGMYRIPAVPKGAKPYLLSVEDKVQSWQMSETFKRQVRRDLITGEEIAADIVATWTTGGLGMTPECHPGIWVVRDSIAIVDEKGVQNTDGMGSALFRPATEEEKVAMWEEDLAHARMADANYAQYLIQTGDAMDDQPGARRFIPNNCKLAARHYGRDREWLHELKDDGGKKCQYCMKVIPGAAVKCGFCSEVVDFTAYAKLEREKKAAVTAMNAQPVKSEARV